MHTGPGPEGGNRRRNRGLLLFAAVFALSALAFVPALGNEFVAWDDDVNFTENPHYRGFSGEHLRWMFTSFYAGHYMPLTWLSAAVDHALWGLDPTGYHLTNLLLHALGAGLFALILLELLRRAFGPEAPGTTTLAAATGALFWALHPLRVESVAWATERRDVLCGAFTLLAVLAWIRSRGASAPDRGHRGRGHWAWYVLALGAYAAGLLSKASAMTLPAVLLVLDAVPLGRLRTRADLPSALLDKLPFLVLAAAGAAIGYLGQVESTDLLASADAAPLGQRLALAAYGIGFYPWKTVLPTELAALYELESPFDPLAARYVISGVAIAGATALLLVLRRRRFGRAALAAWVAYGLLIGPLSGLIQIGWHRAADRYSYLAALPFAALAAAALTALARRRAPGPTFGAAGLALAGLAWLTVAQTAHWRDTESLFRRVVAVDPSSYLGHRKLGIALHDQERYDEAIATYERALELRPPAQVADTLTSLALSTYERAQPGDFPRTLETLAAALDREPTHPLALRMYVDLTARSRTPELGLDRLRAALAQDPDFVDGYLGLARARSAAGDHAGALALCEQALERAPDSIEALNLAGVVLSYLGRYPEAEVRLRAALSLRPDDSSARVNLGVTLERQQRLDEARAEWRRALELDPGNRAAERLLAESGNG